MPSFFNITGRGNIVVSQFCFMNVMLLGTTGDRAINHMALSQGHSTPSSASWDLVTAGHDFEGVWLLIKESSYKSFVLMRV